MATIADNIAELMRIRLEMKEFAKIPDDVPFEQYGAWLAWAGEKAPAQPLMADFVNKRYSMDGVPCRFEDIFEFERLSKAWDFCNKLTFTEYQENVPRIDTRGILLEPQGTNLAYDSINPENWMSKSNADITPLVSSTGLQGINYVSHATRVPSRAVSLPNTDSVRYTLGGWRNTNAIATSLLIRDTTTHTNLKGCSYFPNKNNSTDEWGTISDIVYGSYTCEITPMNAITAYFGSTSSIAGVLEGFNWFFIQVEPGDQRTSLIVTDNTSVTRLPETLTLKNPNQSIIVDADEGIIQDKGTFSGFGHIRKIEVK